ncbi:MAG: response regulator transcription factor [Vampirovibrionales bacterium]
MVRMRALFRRTGVLNQSKTQQQRELLHSGHIQLHPTSLECTVADKRIKLTPTEFEILYCLLQHVGNAVQLSTLLQEVWGYDADEDVRMLRVHVGGLRQKIEPDPKKPSYIETVTNVGYRLNDTPELTADGSALAAAERSEEAVASGS